MEEEKDIKFETESNFIILFSMWISFLIVLGYSIYLQNNYSETITLFAAVSAVTGILYSNYKSDLRTQKQLDKQEKNLKMELKFDRKEEAYLKLFRIFYNEPLAVFDRGYTIDRIKSELEDFLTSRKRLCEYLLKFENECDGFFYIDDDLMIDLIAINEIIKYKQKHKSPQKIYFIEFYENISDIAELEDLLRRDTIGNYLKKIKAKLERYREGNFPLVFVPVSEND